MRFAVLIIRSFLATVCGLAVSAVSAQPIASQFRYPLDNMPAPTQGAGVWNSDWRGNHLGIDLASAGGTPVFAIADGILKMSQYVDALGNAVHIQHALADGSEITSVYYHLRRTQENGPSLREYLGKFIARGTLIGYVTERDYDNGSGDHLHFGIRKGPYRVGLDPDTQHWYYPGYSSIGKTASDRTDPIHRRILGEWEVDPTSFIAARMASSAGSRITINFNQLTAGAGTAFTSINTGGYLVERSAGSWVTDRKIAAIRPSISAVSSNCAITITAGGTLFSIESFVVGNGGTSPQQFGYTISGSRGGIQQFSIESFTRNVGIGYVPEVLSSLVPVDSLTIGAPPISGAGTILDDITLIRR